MNSSVLRSPESLPLRRVVVTGIGLITPLGVGREASWTAIRDGRRATRWLTADDLNEPLPHGTRWAGAPVPERNPVGWDSVPTIQNSMTTSIRSGRSPNLRYASDRDRIAEPVVALACLAADEALRDSGLTSLADIADRCGCVIGTSKVGLRSFARALRERPDDRQSRGSSWSQLWPDAAVSTVAAMFGLRGPSLCPVAACATGLVSIIRGADLIRTCECDLVLAGSADASLVPIVLGSYQRLGVLARGFADPVTACRPFDIHRSGFLIGEGAAVLVLEEFHSARARGAAIYAEFVAGGIANDPSGLMQVEPDGAGLAWLMRDVLRRASVSASELDYINLHGTATRANDLAETNAVRAACGSHADRVPCSSQKGAIGHLLGAAGSVETAIALLALRDQVAPPTMNLESTDPQCDLDYVANVARSVQMQHVLKVSLGLGGHLAVGLFRRKNLLQNVRR